MSEAEKRAVIAWPIVILCAGFLAWAGSDGGQFPTFALVVALILGGQWLAFVPAYLSQSEKFFDLTGSITYLLAILAVLWAHPAPTGRVWLVALLVVVWAVRLGSFLFWRIQKAGKDGRFDQIKPSFIRFLTVWTIQGLWVSFTAAAALAALTNHAVHPLDWTAWLGLVVWLVGFVLEVTADAQKNSFNAQPANKGRFIHTGLWAYSRHPNYLGEILLWVGIAIISAPMLQGWQYITLLSPVFVAFLLLRVSGVPLLEAKADQKWDGQPEYEAYKHQTPVLWPRWSKGEK